MNQLQKAREEINAKIQEQNRIEYLSAYWIQRNNPELLEDWRSNRSRYEEIMSKYKKRYGEYKTTMMYEHYGHTNFDLLVLEYSHKYKRFTKLGKYYLPHY